MPFALLALGILAFVSAYRNTLPQLGALLAGDFSGKNNFLYWLAAMIMVGSLGYFPAFKLSSRAFLLLILVVMILSDKGFFAKFVAALDQPAPAPTPAADGTATASPSSGGGGSGPDIGGAINGAETGGAIGGPAGAAVGGILGALGVKLP